MAICILDSFYILRIYVKILTKYQFSKTNSSFIKDIFKYQISKAPIFDLSIFRIGLNYQI